VAAVEEEGRDVAVVAVAVEEEAAVECISRNLNAEFQVGNDTYHFFQIFGTTKLY
jgi:hypothetical protein